MINRNVNPLNVVPLTFNCESYLKYLFLSVSVCRGRLHIKNGAIETGYNQILPKRKRHKIPFKQPELFNYCILSATLIRSLENKKNEAHLDKLCIVKMPPIRPCAIHTIPIVTND